MSTTQPVFLEERLSPSTKEYLGQIDSNVQGLLKLFDSRVLGGFSEEKEEVYKSNKCYYDALLPKHSIFTGEEDRPLYQELSTQLASLQGEEREAFLYGLRSILVTSQRQVKKVEGKMNRLADLTDKVVGDPQFSREQRIGINLSLSQLQALRGISSGYRDIYMVIVDVVKQQIQKN